MNDLLNILSNSNKDIDNQKLMDYLSGKLSAEEKHEVEKWMADNEFVNEAIEGLQEMKTKQQLQAYVDGLNKELHTYLHQKRERRERKKVKEIPVTYLALIIILVLVVLAFIVIRRAN